MFERIDLAKLTLGVFGLRKAVYPLEFAEKYQRRAWPTLMVLYDF